MFINKNNFSKGGFTLIELLVVISIIGLLSSIVFASLSTARLKARDTKRVVDLAQLRTALALYYDDNGEYPRSGSWGSGNSSFGNPGNWIPNLVADGYISTLPNDPVNNAASPWNLSSNNYSYHYNSYSTNNYQDYNLITRLEDPSNPNRCELKCWAFNSDSSSPGRLGHPWCGASSSNCSGSDNFTIYLYSDH